MVHPIFVLTVGTVAIAGIVGMPATLVIIVVTVAIAMIFATIVVTALDFVACGHVLIAVITVTFVTTVAWSWWDLGLLDINQHGDACNADGGDTSSPAGYVTSDYVSDVVAQCVGARDAW